MSSASRYGRSASISSAVIPSSRHSVNHYCHHRGHGHAQTPDARHATITAASTLIRSNVMPQQYVAPSPRRRATRRDCGSSYRTPGPGGESQRLPIKVPVVATLRGIHGRRAPVQRQGGRGRRRRLPPGRPSVQVGAPVGGRYVEAYAVAAIATPNVVTIRWGSSLHAPMNSAFLICKFSIFSS